MTADTPAPSALQTRRRCFPASPRLPPRPPADCPACAGCPGRHAASRPRRAVPRCDGRRPAFEHAGADVEDFAAAAGSKARAAWASGLSQSSLQTKTSIADTPAAIARASSRAPSMRMRRCRRRCSALRRRTASFTRRILQAGDNRHALAPFLSRRPFHHAAAWQRPAVSGGERQRGGLGRSR